jgi:hypothetical protein
MFKSMMLCLSILQVGLSPKRKGPTTTWPLCLTHSDRIWMGIRLSNPRHDNGTTLSPKLLSPGSTKRQELWIGLHYLWKSHSLDFHRHSSNSHNLAKQNFKDQNSLLIIYRLSRQCKLLHSSALIKNQAILLS